MKAVKKVIISLMLLGIAGCVKEKTYDIDFIVKNQYMNQIEVIYRVRVCSEINNGCSPQEFTDIISPNNRLELFVKDNLTNPNADIKKVFYSFEIYNGTQKSTYDFWSTSKLKKTQYEDRVEYILTVDSTFF